MIKSTWLAFEFLLTPSFVCWVFVYIGFFSYAHGFTLNTWELSLNSVFSLFVIALIVASGIEDLTFLL